MTTFALGAALGLALAADLDVDFAFGAALAAGRFAAGRDGFDVVLRDAPPAVRLAGFDALAITHSTGSKRAQKQHVMRDFLVE